MSDTAQVMEAAGRTGETCRATGPYQSSRNAKVIIFVKEGDRFPADADGSPTTWSLVTDDTE